MLKEIVVARYAENISWLLKLPTTWKITIYNKGPALPPHVAEHAHITVIPLENKGREAETYAYHLMTRYNSFADLTVFIQADPFDHSPEMIELLSNLDKRDSFTQDEAYIPLAIQYDSKFPPPHITKDRDNRFYRVEDMSVYTLDCIQHIDPIGAPWITPQWYSHYNMQSGKNIMQYFFDSVGWKEALYPDRLTIKFSYAACFAVTKQSIHQHSHNFYKNLYGKTFDTPISPYILERAWLHIFNQAFDSSKVLPEYAMENKPFITRTLPKNAPALAPAPVPPVIHRNRQLIFSRKKRI